MCTTVQPKKFRCCMLGKLTSKLSFNFISFTPTGGFSHSMTESEENALVSAITKLNEDATWIKSDGSGFSDGSCGKHPIQSYSGIDWMAAKRHFFVDTRLFLP